MKYMDKNVSIIGDSESIKGFSAIGIDIYPCEAEDDAAHLLRNIADSEKYAIIFITEEVYNSVEKERSRYADRITPAIIPVPGVKGNSQTGKKRLSLFVEKAVGSDIIFND